MRYSPQSPRDAAGRTVYVAERTRNLLVNSDAGGKLLSSLMLPWFQTLPPRGWGVLTTVGRKTGKQRPKCVRAVRQGDKAYLVSLRPGSAWLSNTRANPSVGLKLRSGDFVGLAREPSEAERAEARAVFCETVYLFDYLGCLQHRRGLPRKSKVRELHRSWFDLGVPLVVDSLAKPATGSQQTP